MRVLLQAKGWTAVVVLSLAVGMGGNITLFSTFNALLLKTLPVPDPESLVRLRWIGDNDMVNDSSDYGSTTEIEGKRPHTTFSYPMFQRFREANKSLSDIFATVPMSRVVAVVDGRAETVTALLVSGNYHGVLDVRPQIGRTITLEDDKPSATPVAVISEEYWRSRFASSLRTVGTVVRINNLAVTIVGVAPRAFIGTQRLGTQLSDFTMPISLDDRIGGNAKRISDPTHWWVQIMGRAKSGISPAQVKGNLEPVFQQQARAGMDAYLAGLSESDRRLSENQNRSAVPHLIAESGSQGVYDADIRQVRALGIISAVTALVLFLVCANVANLLLARGSARQKELAVRSSLGATRGRLIRQLLTESVLLAAVGGVASIVIGTWAQELLPPPIGAVSSVDWRVGAFALLMTTLTGMLTGIAPALRETRASEAAGLKENSRSVAGSRSLLSRVLLIAQVSISLLLIVGAGLFLRTLDNLRKVDVGFDAASLAFVRVNASAAGYDEARQARYYDEGTSRLKQVPGVRAATVSFPTLLSGGVNGTRLLVQGRNYPAGRAASNNNSINNVYIAPNYFLTMGISVVAGRPLSEQDRKGAPLVAVINEAAVRKYFPKENPIGQRFGHTLDAMGAVEIVGVVRDVKYNSLREPAPPTLYTPYAQRGSAGLVFTVRTVGDPSAMLAAIREAVADVDRNVPIIAVETQTFQIERRMLQEKVLAQAYTLFGGIALFVAAIGLFGLMSYNVSRRTREIGIRMAMGAQRNEVLALVMRESMLLVGIGIAIGIGASIAAGRLVASQLFGVEPSDVTTIAAAMLVMLTAAAAAGYLPARRAARVDPMVALRYD